LSNFSLVSRYYGISVFLIGLFFIIQKQNRNGEAHLFAGYIIGLEVVLRMTQSNLFFEFGKYAACILLVTGLLLEKDKRIKNYMFPFYFLCLFPGITLTDSQVAGEPWRELVAFNLSGPFMLAVSGLYFYKRKINIEEFSRLGFWMIMPLISILVIIFFYMPQMDELVFANESNPDTSGGFGPNQVSSMLGFGAVIIIIAKYLGLRITSYTILDWLILSSFIWFGFFTFSRGGNYFCGYCGWARVFIISI